MTPEPCSCDEALSLREQIGRLRSERTEDALRTIALRLQQIARAEIDRLQVPPHLRIYKSDGYWTTELHLGGSCREAYVGEPDVHIALERGLSWLRAWEQRQLQANLAGNGAGR